MSYFGKACEIAALRKVQDATTTTHFTYSEKPKPVFNHKNEAIQTDLGC